MAAPDVDCIFHVSPTDITYEFGTSNYWMPLETLSKKKNK
jgi:hypothetical protein